jgi:hypothetical protein
VTVTDSRIIYNAATTSINGGGAIFQLNGATNVSNSCIVCNSDDAIAFGGGTIPMTLGSNWWGSTYGPFYAPSVDGLQCSTGDSLAGGNPLADYGISVTTPSSPTCGLTPIGNWLTAPVASCTGGEIAQVSSISPARLCPRN